MEMNRLLPDSVTVTAPPPAEPITRASSKSSYTTPGKVEQYYDLIAEPIRTTRENARYL